MAFLLRLQLNVIHRSLFFYLLFRFDFFALFLSNFLSFNHIFPLKCKIPRMRTLTYLLKNATLTCDMNSNRIFLMIFRFINYYALNIITILGKSLINLVINYLATQLVIPDPQN